MKARDAFSGEYKEGSEVATTKRKPPRSQKGSAAGQTATGYLLESLTSQDSDILPRSFCAGSSSPQISAILFGHFTGETSVSANLHKSPQFSATLPQTYQNPGSQNSLVLTPSLPTKMIPAKTV